MKPVAGPEPSLADRITAALAEAQAPLPFADLRARCRVRTATLYQHLATLTASGRVIKQGDCYRAGTS